MSQFIEMFSKYPSETPWHKLLTIINGKAYPEEYNDHGTYPICGSAGIMYYGERKLCDANTIILGRKGNINHPIYMESDYWIVDTAFCLDVNKSILLPKYFYYWCCQYDFTKLNKQGVLPSLTRKDLEKIEMSVPPMAEQKKFVSIVEQADKSKFGDFKSQFIEMFGDCVNRIKLSSLCSTFVDGDWIESKDQSELGIRLIQTGNVGNGFFKDKEDKSRYISEETFDNLHCTEIYPGDILVSRLPDPIGRACIIPQGLGRTITAVDCTIIRLKDIILPDYFIAYTMTPSYVAQINEVTTGTTRRRVSRANLGNILIPCPSIAKQQQFVAIAKQADKSKSYVRIAFKNLESMLGYCIRQIS